jgi:hypothetical protein
LPSESRAFDYIGVISLRVKYIPWLFILCFHFLTQDLALGQTYSGRGKYPPKQDIYSINIRYQDAKHIPSLDQHIGLTIAIAPFSDSRRGRQYIGHQMSARKISSYFISEPLPLENAISDFFFEALANSGIKPILAPGWDGKPETLKDLETDSILKINIRRFWSEAVPAGRRTRVKTSVYFDVFLGVKKENRVFTQNMYIGKEMVDYNFTPERLEQFINRTLGNIFEDFFRSL